MVMVKKSLELEEILTHSYGGVDSDFWQEGAV